MTEVEAWGAASTTSNYVYDPAGNVTNDGVHSYVYDAENRLVSVDGGATGQYSYDRSNQRYKKVTVGSTTHYIWQGSKVIAEHSGSTGAVLIDYIYSGGRMIAKVESETSQYFLSDRLSTRLVLDTSGNVLGRQGHLAFGEDFGGSGNQEKHHFTSYERDGESGIDYAVNRHYAPSVGRFMRVDPHRGDCSRANPQSANLYSYVENNSVNRSDPLGLTWRLVGCTTYADGPGRSCTTCWIQDDETDTSKAIVTCDANLFYDVTREQFLIVQEPPSQGGGEPGGSADDGCGACCARTWDDCTAALKTRVKAVGGSKRAWKAVAYCAATCLPNAANPHLYTICFNSCLVLQSVEGNQDILKAIEEWKACIWTGQSRCADARNGDCGCGW